MTSPVGAHRLNRELRPGKLAPIRIVHLGLGAFHRAHQAFYTGQVDPQRDWGIAAFTGRSPDMAVTLASQDGLYTLIERSDTGDSFTTIASIVEAADGADLTRLAELVCAAATAIITLTVTEAAYRVRAGSLVFDDEVRADVARVSTALRSGDAPASLTTIPGRLVWALGARRRAGAGPIAVVSCDNVSDNGAVAAVSVLDFAARVDSDLTNWITRQVSFVGTCVDRITPATTAQDRELVALECGYLDAAPVVTEPFHDWVLSGDFPAGRPRWEDAGAKFVADIGPYETRKLWFLNGAHSLLAYLGQLRGLRTVAEAIADPQCRSAVEAFWDMADGQLANEELNLAQYREQLLARFAHRRISHQLAQIAIDGSVKLRNRIVPVVRAAPPPEREPALIVLAAWIEYVTSLPEMNTQHDVAATDISIAVGLDGAEQTDALLRILEPRWDEDHELRAAVHSLRATLHRPTDTRSLP